MKHSIEKVTDDLFNGDLENLKKLVTYFKKSGLNEKLPPGKALNQEVATRFGTTFDMVNRFVDAAPDLINVIEAADEDPSTKSSKHFDKIQSLNGVYPSFDAILKCFEQIRSAQVSLESSSKPKLILVLPMLQKVKAYLSVLLHGSHPQQSDTVVQSCPTVQMLAKHTLSAFDRIHVHDLWAAVCLIHPGLRSFSFFSDADERENSKAKEMKLLRTMFDQVSTRLPTATTLTTTESDATSRTSMVSNHFHLSSCMSFSGEVTEKDELTRYLSNPVTKADRDLLQLNDGIVDY